MIKPCCRFDTSLQENTRFDIENYEQSRIEYKKLNSKAKNNLIPGCKTCYYEENSGKISMRQRYENLLSGNDKLEYLELLLSTECNARCRMCGAFSSSKWVKTIEDNSFLKKYKELGYYNKTKNKEKLDLLNNLDLSELKHIKYLGGEPFINDDFNSFITIIETKKNIKDIEIFIITNATFFPKKMIKTLSNFKRCTLFFSIDAFGELNSYIRDGCDWNKIEKTLKKWNDIKDFGNFRFGVSTVIQFYNYNRLNELGQFVNENKYVWRPSVIRQPVYLQTELFKKNQWENLSFDDCGDFKHFINNVKNNFDGENRKKDIEKCIEYTDDLDRLFGKSLKKYNKEVYEYLKENEY